MKMESSGNNPASRHVSIKQLRYFVTVAEHRNFRRAADKLCISQPPITKQIQDLERALGVDLLQRQGHKFSLTEAGEAFYAEARMLLAGLDRVCSTSTALIEVLVERGLGVGIASEYSVRPNHPRLRLIPFDTEGSAYRHAVVHRADRASKDLARLLSCLAPEKLPRAGRQSAVTRRAQRPSP